MSDASLNLNNSQVGGDLSTADVTGRDKVSVTQNHEGVPFDQFVDLFTRFLDNQPQVQNLLVTAIESIKARLSTSDRTLHRLSLILVWIASALTGLTLVLTILLAIVLSTLFTVLQPQIASLL